MSDYQFYAPKTRTRGNEILPMRHKPKTGNGAIRGFLWGFATAAGVIWYVHTMIEILQHAYN